MSIHVCGDVSSNPGPVPMPEGGGGGGTGLSVLYFNRCSLVNKTVFLESQLALKDHDIVAVTESRNFTYMS